jgi:putative ABC transport system ATP-binding protein
MGATECVALHAVDIGIQSGEFVSIMGPSGSGKSTLMHLIGCLDRPTAGSYRLDGIEVRSLDDRARSQLRNRKVGFVFQSFNLIPEYDVLENVELPLVYGGVARQERRARAEALLEAVGLSARRQHRPNELSGGERQRVAVARALVHEPPLLLADEPTGNLDSRTGQEIMKLFHDLHARGTTVIIVTHDANVALWSQRTIEVRDGRIAGDSGTPAAVANAEATAGVEPGRVWREEG